MHNKFDRDETGATQTFTISPRTVDNHLVSLYSKLHVSSRAATRCAHEQHLLEPSRRNGE